MLAGVLSTKPMDDEVFVEIKEIISQLYPKEIDAEIVIFLESMIRPSIKAITCNEVVQLIINPFRKF